MKRFRLLAAVFAAGLAVVPAARAADGEALLNARCGACHQRLPDGGLNRISQERKTPEGWDMTIVRMMLIHGVQIAPEERHALVRYLADHQGLAPAETADWRYALERRPNVVEQPEDDELSVMCARCHSYARIALQRRTREEWLKLAHFHLGQYPTTEYQALGRDRNWWEIASTEMPDKLASLYPLDTDAWQAWQAADKPDPAGSWRVVGRHPGKGRYTGTATITAADDGYDISINLSYADGTKIGGSGSGVLYTGYEWRASLDQGDMPIRQVLALGEDGRELSGRWFPVDDEALGADIRMVRLGGDPVILAVEPPYLRVGESASVIIHGAGLEGSLSLGDGVQVSKILYQSPAAIAVEVQAGVDVAPGARTVQVGDIAADGLFTVYDRIDAVRVEPDYAIARVGDNDGPIAPVPAQFDAVAYLAGPDDESGTADDVRIGAMPAAWSVANANETAAAMQDTEYAGRITDTGLFLPAGAGPNPERRYGTNNAGELTVNATIGEGNEAVSSSARLIVTVQRWNDPPIR